ncbi:hypothetical protein PFISCL1PPCAC_15917, partial [Pristionchus fissidentatus]
SRPLFTPIPLSTMSALIKIAAIGCILAVTGADLTREKRQFLVDSLGSSVVDPYLDQAPVFAAPAPRLVYRRPTTVVVQRPAFYPEYFPQRPLMRAYRPVYSQVVPQMLAEPTPYIVRRPTLAVAAPMLHSSVVGPTYFSQPAAVPLVGPSVVAPSAFASDILIKKKKL